MLRDLQSPGFLNSASTSIVFKVMAVVVLPHWDKAKGVSQHELWRLAHELRSEVVGEALANLSLRSLQAVLILVIADWGFGNLSEAWNLIALSKRSWLNVQLT